MGPEDSSLEQHYVIPDYATTLVNPPPDAPVVKVSRAPSLFRFNRRAFLITGGTVSLILLIVGGVLGVSYLQNASSKEPSQGEGSYSVSKLTVGDVSDDELKVVSASETLAVNGQLQIKNTLVLSPSGVPTNPTAGQVYYDKATNTPYFYNGTAFVAISTSIGGISGPLTLGGGLNLVNSTIVNSGVISIQGQSGAVNFASGPGIAINGSTISNSGVLGIAGNPNQLAITSSGGNAQISILGIQPGGVLVGTTGNGINTVLPGGPGECLVSNGSNVPVFASCTGSGGVSSIDAGNGALVNAITIQGSGGISVGSSGNDITIDGSSLALPANYVATLGTLVGLSVSGNSGQGSTPNLSVLYGATSTTALRGDTTLVCPSGTGNLSGGGGTINLADNTSCPNLTVVNSPSFSGSVTATGGFSVAAGKTLTATGSGVDLTAGAGGSDTITFWTANGANSFILPTTGGLGQTICTTAITCAAGGGQAVILEPGVSPQSSAAATAAIFINKTLAATGNLLQLQSNGVDKFVVNNKGELNSLILNGGTAGTDYVTIQGGTQTGAGTLNIPDLNGATLDVCLSTGNCAGLGGGITGSGSSGTLAVFTGSGTIGNSLLSQSGTTTTVGGYLSIPSTLAGPGTIILGNGGTNGSQIQFKNASNSNTLYLQSGATAGNFTLTLPTGDGTANQCLGTNGSGQLAFQDCLTGSGAGGGVTQFNTRSGAITLAGTSNQVIITESPSGTFTLTTPQNIAASSSPTFAGLTLSGLADGIVQSTSGVLSSGAVSRNSATLLSGTLSVANGGTGSTSFNTNGILFGNGSGAVLSTGLSTNAILATNGSGVPDLVSTLPNAVQGNITSTGILSSGSISTGFGTILTGNSITGVGVDSGSGLLQGTGGLTLTGAVNINTSGSGATSIGNSGSGGAVAIQSSGTIGLTGLVTVQPAASLTSGQIGLSQTVTNGASSSGTVTAYNQSITVNNTVAANTTIGHNISISDSNGAGLINTLYGLNINVAGAASNGLRIGANISTNKGPALLATTTAPAQLNYTCANQTTSGSIAICADDLAGSTSGAGLYARTTSRSGVSMGDFNGSGVYGVNTASGSPGYYFAGVRGLSLQTTNTTSTSAGIYGEASGGAAGTAYGGYFALSSTSAATNGAALLATNSSTTADILQLYDNGTNVVEVADGGAAVFRNSTNSTTGFQIQNAAGSSNLFIADTTNTRIGIGRAATTYTLEVEGDAFSNSGFIAETGSNTSKLLANNLQFNSTGTSHIDQLGAGGSLDITTRNTAGSSSLTRLTIGSGDNASVAFTNGQYSFRPATDTTTAFQVQNAAAGNLFNIDSSNTNITINGANTPTVQAWQTGNNSGFLARESHTAVVANGFIYIIGGINSGTTATTTVQYAKINANGNVGNWSTVAALPGARDHPSAVFANGYIYVTGGATDESAATSHSQVYYAKVPSDGNITSWTTSANPIFVGSDQPRWRHSSVAANGYLYVIGGQDASGVVRSTVYKSKLNPDGSNGTWSSAGTTLNTATFSHSSVVANGYVYAIAGNSSAVSQYAKLNADGSIGSWNTTTSLPAVRHDSGVAVINGTIYIIGGENSGYHANTFYATLGANGAVGAWNCQGTVGSCGSASPVNSTSLPGTRSEFSSVPVTANGYIYVIGGWNAATNSTVYYTSTSRVSINGSLDLVGTSGQNLNEGNSGGALTAGNTNIIGALNVQDTANFVQSVSMGADLNVGGMVSVTGNMAVKGQVTLTNSSNSVTAFQVQNASGTTLLGIDTQNSRIFSNVVDGGSAVGFKLNVTNAFSTSGAKLLSVQNATVEKFAIDKDGHITVYGHYKSLQTTAPTIGTPSNCGTSPSASVVAASTDSAGAFGITTGTGGAQTTCDTVVTFNVTGGNAPKSVIVVAQTKDGGTGTAAARQVYVSNSSTSSFTVKMNSAPADSEVNYFYYWVIE